MILIRDGEKKFVQVVVNVGAGHNYDRILRLRVRNRLRVAPRGRHVRLSAENHDRLIVRPQVVRHHMSIFQNRLGRLRRFSFCSLRQRLGHDSILRQRIDIRPYLLLRVVGKLLQPFSFFILEPVKRERSRLRPTRIGDRRNQLH